MDATEGRSTRGVLDDAGRLQLQVVLPYKLEPRQHPRVRRYLDRGYRIESLQRLSDREALVTLARP